MNSQQKILVVDDEPQLRKLLSIALEGPLYKILECENGKDAAGMLATHTADLVLLDLGLPDIDGKEVITSIRQWSQTPIIVCSVRNEDDEVIQALHLGANDYMTKPFNPEVLVARIAANLRNRSAAMHSQPELVNGKIRMDMVRHEVSIDDKIIPFTPKEFELLRYFLTHRGKMLTHKQILKEVWGVTHGEDTQYLRVYVSQLRDKIVSHMTPEDGNPIVTERGIGYRMEIVAPVEPDASESIAA
jgi:two-component system KDP operon response regulator KdpE